MSPDDLVLDDKYFDELLRRIRSIRASEKRFYKQIREIYKIGSCDYDSNSEITNIFFASVQNKFHLAITGCTATELILKRVDASKDNMGLTNWKNSPEGNIVKNDIYVAKNYYTANEIEELEAVVTMFMEYAERQAILHNPMYMEDWIRKLDEFLKFNDYEMLENSKNPSRKTCNSYAAKEFEKYKNS